MNYSIEQFNFIVTVKVVNENDPVYACLKRHSLHICGTLYALPPGKVSENKCIKALNKHSVTWFSFRIAEETSSRQEKLKYELLQKLNKKLESELHLLETARTGKKQEDALREIALFASGFSSLNTGVYSPIALCATEIMETIQVSSKNNEKIKKLRKLIKTRSFNTEWDIWAEKEGRNNDNSVWF